METSTYKSDGIYAKELEDELMKYTKYDHKVETNLDEKSQKTDEVQTNGDVEVNITECTRSVGAHDLVAAEYQNTTESSSSFGDSNCGAENVDTLDDSEVSSDFRGESASAPNINEFGERFRMRRKKLTTHWRAFIQPLMWRCKWVELQIMKLQSQAQQYDRELEAYNKKKETQFDNSTMVDAMKSLPFLRENARSDVFKRKKRRTEATVDIASYMSQHNLFSCYENRKCLTEGAFMNTESKNPATQKIGIDDEIWGDEELLSFDPGNGDDSLEYMLWKIDLLQTQVHNMKSKVDTIKRENAERLSFADSLNWPPPDNENAMEGTYISSETMSALPPQIAATSHGDLPAANGGIGHAYHGAHKRVEDGVLIDNQKVKQEMDNFEEVKIHPIQKPLELKDGSDGTTTADVAEPDLPEDQPPLKIRSISKLTPPKGKRKRGRKRGAVGRWSRRTTG